MIARGALQTSSQASEAPLEAFAHLVRFARAAAPPASRGRGGAFVVGEIDGAHCSGAAGPVHVVGIEGCRAGARRVASACAFVSVDGRGPGVRGARGAGRCEGAALHFVGGVPVRHDAAVRGFLGGGVILEGLFDGEGGFAFAFVVFREVFLGGVVLVCGVCGRRVLR